MKASPKTVYHATLYDMEDVWHDQCDDRETEAEAIADANKQIDLGHYAIVEKVVTTPVVRLQRSAKINVQKL